MTDHRTWFASALFLLAPALAGFTADTDLHGDPLPEGAKARLGTLRWRNQTYPTPMLAPDGKSFYATSAGAMFRLDPTTGAKLDKVPAESVGVPTGFSADGKRAVSAQYDRFTVWDTDTGKAIAKVERRLPSGDAAVSISADGKRVAAGGTPDQKEKAPITVLIWDVDQNKEVTSIKVPQNNQVFVALSADGKTVANWGYHYDSTAKPTDQDTNPGRFVYFWDAATGKELAKFRAPGYSPAAVAFSPDGALAAVASGNNAIDLVDPKTGAAKQVLLGRTRMGRFATFSPDGTTVAATGDDGAVQRWRVADGTRLSTTEPPVAGAYNTRVRLFDNEKGLAWGTKGSATVVWEVPSGKSVSPEGVHTATIRGVTVTADNKYAITSTDDGVTLKWELTTGKPAGEVAVRRVSSGYSGYTYAAHFSPDGSKALVLDQNSAIGVHDMTTGTQLYVIPVVGEGGRADGRSQSSFSADSSKVVVTHSTAYDAKVKMARATVWDANTSKRLGAVELPGYTNVAAAVTSDGKYLVTAGTKPSERGAGTFVITGWELATGAKKGERSEDAGYAYVHVVASKDNKSVALVTSKGDLVAFDLLAGTRGQVYDTRGRAPGLAPVFSPDGKRLAVACQSGSGESPTAPVLVFDWATGETKYTFASPGGTPQALAFSPDGKYLLTGAPDTTATVWDVSK